MLSKYSNKHAFLSEATSPHTVNLILNIIYKDIVKKTDLLLIIFGTVSSNKSIEKICKAHEIEVLKWDEVKRLQLCFLTLNPLSLSSIHNSGIITYCIDNQLIEPCNINILIQDDELDRWSNLYKDLGSLQVSDTALIDEEVLNILRVVDNYIVPYENLGKRLEEIIGRKLNIIDATLPFNLLDYRSQSILEEFIVCKNKSVDSSRQKILIFTKPHSIKDTFFAVSSSLIKNRNLLSDKNITLGIWFNYNLKGVVASKILSALIKFNNVPVEIEIHKNIPHSQYFLMLHDYNCLILQRRGGFSTAKYFAEKIGKVITLKDSPNDLSFRKDYMIETFSYNDLKSALNSAFKESHINDIKKIKIKSAIEKRHKESFVRLKYFWDSF